LVGVRTVSIVVSADGVESLPGVVAVTVAALPIVTSVPSVVATTPVKLYVGGGVPVILDTAITLIDVDSDTVTKATVAIGVGYVSGSDTLAYTGSGPITGSWDVATGTLTLTGVGTVAQYQEALREVTFASTGLVGVRTVSIVVSADGVESLPGVVAVTVAALPLAVPPLVVGSLINAIPYTVGNDPVGLDRFVIVADDSTTIKGAVVRITNGKQTGDVLAFTPANGITATYDSVNGTLTLVGNATVEQYQQALRSVTFATTTGGLVGLRTFTFEVTDVQDLTGTSLPFTATVVANALPLLSLSPSSLSVSVLGSGLPKVLDPLLTIADDSTKMSGATVTITGGVQLLATESLTVTLPNGSPITTQWSPVTRTLTLSGVATAAEYQAALQTATWDLTGVLSLGTRTFTYVVRDQQGTASVSSSLTVTLVSIL
jgi:hypothetical protein